MAWQHAWDTVVSVKRNKTFPFRIQAKSSAQVGQAYSDERRCAAI